LIEEAIRPVRSHLFVDLHFGCPVFFGDVDAFSRVFSHDAADSATRDANSLSGELRFDFSGVVNSFTVIKALEDGLTQYSFYKARGIPFPARCDCLTFYKSRWHCSSAPSD
jgi:hypothetical protein